MRALRAVKYIVFTIGQALVDMSTAAGQLLVWFGHKTGHAAKASRDFFDAGLE